MIKNIPLHKTYSPLSTYSNVLQSSNLAQSWSVDMSVISTNTLCAGIVGSARLSTRLSGSSQVFKFLKSLQKKLVCNGHTLQEERPIMAFH